MHRAEESIEEDGYRNDCGSDLKSWAAPVVKVALTP